jgi:hypothetical protein
MGQKDKKKKKKYIYIYIYIYMGDVEGKTCWLRDISTDLNARTFQRGPD